MQTVGAALGNLQSAGPLISGIHGESRARGAREVHLRVDGYGVSSAAAGTFQSRLAIVRQNARGHERAVHIVGHGIRDVRAFARELPERRERSDLAFGQSHGLLATYPDGDGLARARTDQRETLEIGGLWGAGAPRAFLPEPA